MEKLFGCAGRTSHDGDGEGAIPAAVMQRLDRESQRHAQATVSRSLEQNNTHFNEAREKLERWADDMVLSAEKALLDTKEQIKALRRQSRQAVTLVEQHGIQEKIRKLERRQRRQRQEIFKVEDEIIDKRRPTHRLAGAPAGATDRDGDTLHHPLGGDVSRRTIMGKMHGNPTVSSLNILIERLREGRFVIPDFQREFEGKPWDVRDLMRPIRLDDHIGGLLLRAAKQALTPVD